MVEIAGICAICGSVGKKMCTCPLCGNIVCANCLTQGGICVWCSRDRCSRRSELGLV